MQDIEQRVLFHIRIYFRHKVEIGRVVFHSPTARTIKYDLADVGGYFVFSESLANVLFCKFFHIVRGISRELFIVLVRSGTKIPNNVKNLRLCHR